MFNASTYSTTALNYFINNTVISTTYVPSRLGTAIGAIVAFTFIIFGLLGNLLIIVSILQKRELRTNVVNIFIVSTQLNDIFNIGFNQFFVGLAYAFMKWKGSELICELVVYTSIICTGALLWHHALIAIHRYLVVVCNQTTTFMGMSSKIYVMASLIIARLIPSLVCTPALLKKMTEYSPTALRCMLAPRISGYQSLLIFVINIIVPCIIVAFCFIRIFTRVHTVSKNIRRDKSSMHNNKRQASLLKSTRSQSISNKFKTSTNPDQQQQYVPSMTSSMHREIQISKMFALIFTVFLFGYLPYGLIRMVDKSNSLHPDYYILLTVVFIVSISISPIIYGLMNTQIRSQCAHIIQSICKGKNLMKNDFNQGSRHKKPFLSGTQSRAQTNKSLLQEREGTTYYIEGEENDLIQPIPATIAASSQLQPELQVSSCLTTMQLSSDSCKVSTCSSLTKDQVREDVSFSAKSDEADGGTDLVFVLPQTENALISDPFLISEKGVYKGP